MRRGWWFVALALVAVLVASVWLWRSRESHAGQVSVGVILPLTGDGAKYGATARKAIDLAFGDVNASGGIKGTPLRAIYEDSQGKPQQGVSALQKLITLDHVKSVIGDLFSSVTLAMAPIAESNRVVILSPTSSAPAITKAGDYIFRNCASDEFEGRAMAEAAVDRLGIRRVAILYTNNDYGVGIVTVFRKRFVEKGGTVVAEEAFLQGANDFRAQLTKLRSVSSDAVYIVGYKELGQVLKQASELGLKRQFLSTVMFEDPEILRVAGPAADGVVYSARAYDAENTDTQTRTFVREFRERYGETPDIFAAFSYDAANILARAIRTGGADGEGIKNALYAIKDFKGVCGPASFDENGDVSQPAFLKTTRQGAFVWFGQK
jgi:branched-chain amino acid transport system substrate-binding protein